MRALVLLAAAGCWTGGGTTVSEPAATDESSAPARPRGGFRLKLERMECTGPCPTYSLVIQADGRVDWNGSANVLAYGQRSGRVTAEELVQLERLVVSLRFFDRDEYGQLPVEQQCTTSNGTTSCSMAGSFAFCRDSRISHTVITVTRNRKTHRVDNANCSDDDDLAPLEHLVNRIANVRAWVHE